MTLTYTLEEEDFLALHLYFTFEDEKSIKHLLKIKFILVGLFVFIGLNSYNSNNSIIALLMGVFSILTFIFFKKIFKFKIKKLYSKTIRSSQAKRLREKETISFTSDYIIITSKIEEHKTKTSEIQNSIETKDHFFIKSAQNSYFIIPKKDIDNLDLVKNNLKKLNIDNVENLTWTL